jgi:PUA-domain protein
MPKRCRYFMKEKDSKKFFQDVSNIFHANFEQLLGKKIRIEINETENAEIFFFNGKPLVARSNGDIFPTLSFQELFSVFPKIVVDMGAVPYVCKGADVMAPGIVSVNGEFEENDIVIVVDERHSKPLAVGLALLSTENMKTVTGGKIVKNLHYVGDKLWYALKS